jgi:copper chaperone CopZ
LTSNNNWIALTSEILEIKMKKTFLVPDMSCPNCAMHLEGLEDELPGVQRITASYKKLVMEVEFDETILSTDQIIAAANAIGYHPEVKTS